MYQRRRHAMRSVCLRNGGSCTRASREMGVDGATRSIARRLYERCDVLMLRSYTLCSNCEVFSLSGTSRKRESEGIWEHAFRRSEKIREHVL